MNLMVEHCILSCHRVRALHTRDISERNLPLVGRRQDKSRNQVLTVSTQDFSKASKKRRRRTMAALATVVCSLIVPFRWVLHGFAKCVLHLAR